MKLGTNVEHIIAFVLRYGAILKYSPGVYIANQKFQNLRTIEPTGLGHCCAKNNFVFTMKVPVSYTKLESNLFQKM